MRIETTFEEGSTCRSLWYATSLQIEGKASELLELFEKGRGSVDGYETAAFRATRISIFRQIGSTSRKPGGLESAKSRLVLETSITPLDIANYAASTGQRDKVFKQICDCFRITYHNATTFRAVIDFR